HGSDVVIGTEPKDRLVAGDHLIDHRGDPAAPFVELTEVDVRTAEGFHITYLLGDGPAREHELDHLPIAVKVVQSGAEGNERVGFRVAGTGLAGQGDGLPSDPAGLIVAVEYGQKVRLGREGFGTGAVRVGQKPGRHTSVVKRQSSIGSPRPD